MADELISRMRVPDGTSNVYVLKDEVARSRTEYEMTTKTGNPIVLESGGQSVDDLKVQLEPIQDLHGYDHPWAGGAGKNLILLTLDAIKAANTRGTWNGDEYSFLGITFSFERDNGGNILSVVANGTSTGDWVTLFIPFSLKAGTYTVSGSIDGQSTTYRIDFGSLGIVYTGQRTATIDSDADTNAQLIIRNTGYTANNVKFYPMIRLSTETDATFEPYSNICPISGYDEVDILRTGKNKLNTFVWQESKIIDYTITATRNSDGTYKIVGSALNVPSWLSISSNNDEYLDVNLPSGTYTISLNRYDKFRLYINDDTTIGYERDITFTGVLNSIRILLLPGFEFNDALEVQIESGSTATDYEPYSGQSIQFTLDNTVYGGTLDVDAGTLVVDRGYVDLGTLDWNYTSSYGPTGESLFRSHSISDMTYIRISGTVILPNIKCSNYKTANPNWQYANPSYGTISIWSENVPNTGQVLVRDSSYTDAASFKTAMSGVQLVYELATPTTIQLTPAQLTLLKGHNYISTNGTTLELTCRDGLFMLAGDPIDYDCEISTVTLYAANWSNGVYTITDNRIDATSVQEYMPGLGITDAQLEALQAANIHDFGQDADHAYLKAYGDVPSIDIPIRVMFNPGVTVREVEQQKQDIYSTTEQVIGTWIDGKPIYRKVFVGITGTASANTWFSTGIDATYVGTIVDWNILAADSGTSYRTNVQGAWCAVQNNLIKLYVQVALDVRGLILEYTKTTD